MKFGTHSLIIFLLMLCPLGLLAQEEEEMRKNALELFEQEDYDEALKLYSTLLSINKQSAEYNYRFGACHLFTEQDKEESLTFLKYAVEIDGHPALARFYYGYGLHLNYQFDKAINQYNRYKEQMGKKERESELVDHYIQMCEDGKTLVSSFTDISVVQRTVLPRSDFYRNYDLSEFGGKIIVKPEDFMSEEDKKRDGKFLMYFQQDADIIYYASYSEKNATGKDLYMIQKLPGGEWSQPSKLPATINTSYDEDYPFIHPEGSTLYFASKGHNSMGGYDIFKSDRRGDGSWTEPVNMEFAINTPWDEFMFITDLEEKSAWFASNRETSNKQVTVYRIGMERIPLDLTLIKGVFETEDGSRKAKITVEDMVQNRVVGIYNSERQLGDYLLDLKGSGKYKFTVEAEESNTVHTGIVEVPREKGLKQFRQEMKLVVTDGREQLQIINHFDEPITDEQLLTADILKKQASLDVNASELDIISGPATSDASTVGDAVQGNPDNLSNQERIDIATTALNVLKESADDFDKKAAALYEVVQQKYNSDNPDEIAEAAIAAELASIYKIEADKRSEIISQMEGTLNVLETGNLEPAAFDAQYNQLAAKQNNFKAPEKFEKDLEKDFEQRMDPTISAYETKNSEVSELKDDLTAIDEEIAYYEQEIENTKDDLVKEELQLQVQEANASKPQKQASIDRAQAELDVLSDQKSKAESYNEMSANLLDQAAAQAPQMTSSVSMAALNQIQSTLEAKAAGNPALLAFVTPELADEALAENLSDSRKENAQGIGEGDDSMNLAAGAASNDSGGDINEQIKAIEASESEPEIIPGDYDAYFEEAVQSATASDDPIIAESRKAELYDQWAENIMIDIDSLEKLILSEEDPATVTELQNEVNLLKADKAEKESLAMASYQAIASMSDAVAAGETLPAGAAGGTAAGGTTGAGATTPVSGAAGGVAGSAGDASTGAIGEDGGAQDVAAQDVPPIPKDVLESEGLPEHIEVINNTYEANLKMAQTKSSDPMVVTTEQANIYQEWANALEDELNVFAAQINNASSDEEKRILEEKAALVGELRMEKVAASTTLKQEVSTVEQAQEIKASTNELQEQLFEYVENYNPQAFNQINDQIAIIPDETLRAAQTETLHKNWMMALLNEEVKLDARIENSTDSFQIADLRGNLEDIQVEKKRVQFVLDSLESPEGVDGPKAPESIYVKGSEQFEGYIPVENPKVETYATTAEEKASIAEDAQDEVNALETQLAETKKKKKKAEIEDNLIAKDGEQKVLQMQAEFYAEASEKLAAVEPQLLTMEEGDKLPSQRQAQEAKQLQDEADQATAVARDRMEAAEAIKKKKQRLPAIRDARVLELEASVKRQRADLSAALVEEMKILEQNTIDKNFIIPPSQEVVLPMTRRKLNPNEIEDVRSTPEFKNYAAEIREADSLKQVGISFGPLERQYQEQGQQLLESAATAPVSGPPGTTRADLTEQAYERFEKSDSVSALRARIAREATYMENEANRDLLTLPEEAYMNIIAYYNTVGPQVVFIDRPVAEAIPEQLPLEGEQQVPVDSETPSSADDQFSLNEPVNDRNETVPVERDVLTETIFEIAQNDPQSEYSESNPIPVDPPMPSGLMYKVQIGAFRNPIKQDAFKGITPIVGESTNQGFTRYSAGEFNAFGDADNAKSRIQGIGYSDAFVVAYLNGQRISVAEARAYEAGGPAPSIASTGGAVQTPGAGVGTAGTSNARPGLIKQGPMEIQSVENIPGTFFTVQVGVYSKPVTSKEIYNISPLLQENLSSGLYRYTTGKFDNENTALRARDEARSIGVVDAFVTAYRDGVRVTVDQARGSATPSPQPVQQPTQQTPPPASASGYQINLGTFSGAVPVQQASLILMLSSEGVNKQKNADGSSTYLYGKFNSQAEAEQRASELRNQGLTEAKASPL